MDFTEDNFSYGKPEYNRPLKVIGGTQDFSGHVPPHSREAEEHFLSCCLLPETGQSTLARARAAKLGARAFYIPAHRVIFGRILVMYLAQMPIDQATLCQELEQAGELDGIGGFNTIIHISNRAATSAQAGYFLDKLMEFWVLREWITESTTAVELCYDSHGDLEELLSKHASKMQRMADFARNSRRESQRDQAKAAREAAMKAAAGEVDRSRWLTFGLPHADGCFEPIDVKNEDWLFIVAGPPSGGKSSVMRQVAGANLELGKCGVIFLLETGLRRWLQALAACYAHVDLRKLNELPKDRLAVFDGWMQTVESWVEERLWIFDDVYHLEDIERVTREVNRRVIERKISAGADPLTVHGLDFSVVDYLQLMDMRVKFRGMREEKVAMMAKGLKKLYKSVDITGFVGSQLNRKSREESRQPRLTDLRESGAIEQDADVVLAVYTPLEDRAGVVQDGTRSTDEVEWLQLKRRNGRRDVGVDLIFHKTHCRYSDDTTSAHVRPGLAKVSPGYHHGKGGVA